MIEGKNGQKTGEEMGSPSFLSVSNASENRLEEVRFWSEEQAERENIRIFDLIKFLEELQGLVIFKKEGMGWKKIMPYLD